MGNAAVPEAPERPLVRSCPATFHGLRQCAAASLMLASGADIAVVSKLLAHASIRDHS
jgi:integrase